MPPPTATAVITFRRVTAADVGFLHALYAETRAPEFAGLPADRSELVVRMQHDARSAGYAAAYPDSVDEVIEVDGQAVGRILVDETAARVHVVDLAVLRGHRGRGLATAALARWTARAREGAREGVREGAREGARPVTLTVFGDSPAVELYRRLGFRSDRAAGAGRLGMTLDTRPIEKEAGR